VLEIFINNEKGYLRWATTNPNGYIVNADNDFVSPHYPMVHRATHKAMTSTKNSRQDWQDSQDYGRRIATIPLLPPISADTS